MLTTTPRLSKLPDVGTTIFTVMSQLAHQYKAINLAQGFPDFGTSGELISLVHKYMEEGFNQYAPMPGILPLREKIGRKTSELYGYTPDPETEITLTSGATEACYVAITSIVHPGDEVIVFEPAFDSYVSAIRLSGGKPVFIQMQYPHFTIDWQKVKDKVNSKTKLIIINSPHNPTGAVINKHDIVDLESIVSTRDIYILSDEVYEHMVFDHHHHESILKYPGLRRKSFVVSSFGKTYHSTGWRMGYCIAPAALSKEFRKIHQYVTFSAHTPTQYALNDYIQEKEHYLKLPAFFEGKRNLFLNLMKKSRFEFFPAKGSYFQLASYKNISNETDVDFSKRLVEEHGVAVIPVSSFYHNNKDEKVIRFCLAKKDETLEKAAEILCRI